LNWFGIHGAPSWIRSNNNLTKFTNYHNARRPRIFLIAMFYTTARTLAVFGSNAEFEVMYNIPSVNPKEKKEGRTCLE
jgi:hypothetical protein